MIGRRGVLAGLVGAGMLTLTGCSEKVTKALGFAQRMIDIEKRHGGRIGVSALTGHPSSDASQNGTLSIQSEDRFAMCSTFKWVLAAHVLKRVDDGQLKLSQVVKYGKADLLDYAPVSKANVAKGQMTLLELCAAMVEASDNTAANLVLGLTGGPSGLTAFVRALGDTVTRFDRTEPSLNTNSEKDERDTTTPAAMSTLLRTVYTGRVLKAESLAQLKAWMVAVTTGDKRIRAGVPQGSVVADKTGTGENGATNDVAIIWPPNEPPVFLSIYTSGGTLDADGRNAVIADITQLVFDTLGFIGTLDHDPESTSASS